MSAQELHADLVGRLPHLWLTDRPWARSTLDLLGPALTLLTGDGDAWVEAADGPATPVTVQGLAPASARQLGVSGDAALLVRPDGAVVGRWETAADASYELWRAVESVTCARTALEPVTA